MVKINIEGLEIKRITEIPNLEKKMSIFLDSLNEETKTWRDFETRNGHRIIPHPIDGYACLDGDKIVGINYFILPRKNSLTYFIHKIFPAKEAETGAVVKKEYQRRGINTTLGIRRRNLLRNLGYKRVIFIADITEHRIKQLNNTRPGRKEFIKNNKFYHIRELSYPEEDEI